MRANTRAVLTLIVATPILAEVVSTSTPAHALLDPRVDLALLLGYGLPVLVIRELASRWRLPEIAVVVLGMAYGILNEGPLAQTLFRVEHVPIDRFDRYIYAGGFNLGWAGLIVPWHAFMSVQNPIALVSGSFPAGAETPWLGKRSVATLAALLVALLVFVCVARPPRFQMLISLLAMAILVGLAAALRRASAPAPRRNERRALAFTAGFAFYCVFFLGLIVLAAIRVPVPIYFAAFAVLLTGGFLLGRRADLLVLPAAGHVALGAYFAAAVFEIAAGVARGSIETGVTGGLFAALFATLALSRRARAWIAIPDGAAILSSS